MTILWDRLRLPTTLPTVTSLKCPLIRPLWRKETQIRSKRTLLGQNKRTQPPQVATVDDHEEDLEEEGLKPENPSLSEQDEALTEDEDDSSYGDASQFAAVPNLQRLVVLNSDHCRSPCHIKNKDGVKTPSICGKRATSCQQHAKHREKGNYRHREGAYLPTPVSRGFPGHGLARGPYYTHEQFQELENTQREEMSRLVMTMNETGSDQDELEELSRDLRVRFQAKVQTSEPTADDLQKTLAAKTGGLKATPKPRLWFGMRTKTIDRSGKTDRWITSDPIIANDAATRPGCSIAQVFHSREEAEDWTKDDDGPMSGLHPQRMKRGLLNGESDSSENDNSALNAVVGRAAKIAYRKKKK
jgi:hypothetical protein